MKLKDSKENQTPANIKPLAKAKTALLVKKCQVMHPPLG
jgi:hypothetical protein